MKVLIFSHEYPNFGGGAGVVAKQLANDMTSKGVTVDLLTRARANNDLININTCYEVEYKIIPWFLAYSSYIKIKMKLSDYDLIICNDNISQYIAGLVFSKKQLKKTVMLFHGSEPEFFYLNKSIKSRLLCFEKVYNRAIEGASECIAHSFYMKDKILEYTSSKISSNSITVFYFGYDHNLFNIRNTKTEIVRNRYGLRVEDTILLTAGRVVEKKGFLRKLKLLNEVRIHNKNIKWLIIGDGPFLEKLRAEVKACKLEDAVFFLGKVPRENLSDFYRVADLFWMLSEFKESFGLVYIEAQACGTPAIGNNLFGVKEAIINQVTGLLADSDKDIIEYIKSEAFNKHDLNNITSFANEFHSDKFSSYLIENHLSGCSFRREV